MELKEGMYVRIKANDGIQYIGKLVNINEFRELNLTYCIDIGFSDYIFISKEKIIHASFNVLELLEEEDYAEIEYFSPRYEERVKRRFEIDYRTDEYLTLKNSHCDFVLLNFDWIDSDKKLNPIIKSVITKQQIEDNSYRIGE